MDGPKLPAARPPRLQRVFEPNRLHQQFIARAYERLIPAIRRSLLRVTGPSSRRKAQGA
jgi:hypothetical protein